MASKPCRWPSAGDALWKEAASETNACASVFISLNNREQRRLTSNCNYSGVESETNHHWSPTGYTACTSNPVLSLLTLLGTVSCVIVCVCVCVCVCARAHLWDGTFQYCLQATIYIFDKWPYWSHTVPIWCEVDHIFSSPRVEPNQPRNKGAGTKETVLICQWFPVQYCQVQLGQFLLLEGSFRGNLIPATHIIYCIWKYCISHVNNGEKVLRILSCIIIQLEHWILTKLGRYGQMKLVLLLIDRLTWRTWITGLKRCFAIEFFWSAHRQRGLLTPDQITFYSNGIPVKWTSHMSSL